MAWVIEKKGDGGQYFTPFGWTSDVNRAMDFATEADAAEFINTTPAVKTTGVPRRADKTAEIGHGRATGVARAEYDLYGIDPKTGALR